MGWGGGERASTGFPDTKVPGCGDGAVAAMLTTTALLCDPKAAPVLLVQALPNEDVCVCMGRGSLLRT